MKVRLQKVLIYAFCKDFISITGEKRDSRNYKQVPDTAHFQENQVQIRFLLSKKHIYKSIHITNIKICGFSLNLAKAGEKYIYLKIVCIDRAGKRHVKHGTFLNLVPDVQASYEDIYVFILTMIKLLYTYFHLYICLCSLR